MIRSRGIGRNVEGESMRVQCGKGRGNLCGLVRKYHNRKPNPKPGVVDSHATLVSEKIRGVDYNCEKFSQRKELVSTKGLVIVFCT